MILLEKCAHLVLEASLCMVPRLLVNVPNQRIKVGWPNREQAIPTLPSELRHTFFFHPHGRRSLEVRHNLRRSPRRRQTQRQMNMIGNSSHSKAFTVHAAGRACDVGMQPRSDVITDQRHAVLSAEYDMHQIQTEGLRHGYSLVSGFQPFLGSSTVYLGLRPRLLCFGAFGPRTEVLREPVSS